MDPKDATHIVQQHFATVTPEEFRERAAEASHGDTESVFDYLRILKKRGVPIFQKDYKTLARDVIRAQYHAVRAQLTNPLDIFPSGLESITRIWWIATADDVSLNEEYPHMLESRYERGTEENGRITTITILENRHLPARTDEEILTLRKLALAFIPEEKRFSDETGTIEWYRQMERWSRY